MKIKNLFILILCLLFTNPILSQQQKRVEAFLDYKYKGDVDIYTKPNGKIFGKIINYMFDEEDIIIFHIKNQNDSMFYVTAYYNYESDSITGWIKKSDNIDIYSRAYDRPSKLYIQPDEKSEVILSISYIEMFIVTSMKNNWLKVKITYKGEIYEGWIPPYMQCANPYSTCS
jgi:hypothetical protein